MHIERIKEAVRFLKQVHLDGRNFDYKRWGSKTECGTIACAGGWLTLNKKFQADGLYPFDISIGNLAPAFRHLDGVQALAQFFDIPLSATVTIFIYAENIIKKHTKDITAYDIAELLEKLLPPEDQVEEHCVIETPHPVGV